MAKPDITVLSSSAPAPRVFYTYFYNHAHRLRLEKLLYIKLSTFLEVSADILNHFWIQVAVSELNGRYVAVSEVKRLQINLWRLYVTAIPQRTKLSVWV
jgi:hypothetical protein